MCVCVCMYVLYVCVRIRSPICYDPRFHSLTHLAQVRDMGFRAGIQAVCLVFSCRMRRFFQVLVRIESQELCGTLEPTQKQKSCKGSFIKKILKHT